MTRILNIRSRHAPVKKNFYSSHFNMSRYQSAWSARRGHIAIWLLLVSVARFGLSMTSLANYNAGVYLL